MKALVTGATGFVGSAVVRELLRNGEEVRVLVRPNANRLNLQGLDVEETSGDITDFDSVRRAMRGCDRVYHVAALYTMADPPQAYYRINVEGTRNVLTACFEMDVRRVVYTSTIAAVGSARAGRPADEETVWDLGEFFLPYVTTKYLAEVEAWRACARGLPVVVVNPTAPMGERDLKPTPTGKLIVDFLNGRMPLYPRMSLNVIDADDVAAGHRFAMEKGRPGERYILGGENVSVRQILAVLSRLTGVPAPRWPIPYSAAWVAGLFGDLVVAGLLGRSSILSLASVRFLKRPMQASNKKALQELGLTLTPLEDCLKKAVRWFHTHGYVKRPIKVP